MTRNDVGADEPVHLVEDPSTGDRMLVYGTEKGIRLDIRYEGENLWMSQAQISELFGRDVSTVSRHIANVFAEGELEEATSLQKVQTSTGRPATLYSLDVVISVGYRISSSQATLFRKWATQKLVQFATKGFVVDTDRLKQPENSDRIIELRDIIRDIRADEANVYRELRRICAMCQDYAAGSENWREFYQFTQAKLLCAVTSHTPAEIIISRAASESRDMGLTSWPRENIRKQDVVVSKNYLAPTEVKELNRLTTILLDIFEDQLDLGRLIVMDDVKRLLDAQLRSLGRTVLSHGGRVKMSEAKAHAERAYEVFAAQRKVARHQQADDAIAALRTTERSLKPSRKRP